MKILFAPLVARARVIIAPRPSPPAPVMRILRPVTEKRAEIWVLLTGDGGGGDMVCLSVLMMMPGNIGIFLCGWFAVCSMDWIGQIGLRLVPRQGKLDFLS